MVFTGRCTGGDFRGGGEGGDDGGEDDVGALSGIDGRVQAPGAVVVHQRDRLPVVGLQAGVQRRLVVVTAAHERLARYLRDGKQEGKLEEGKKVTEEKKSSVKTIRNPLLLNSNMFFQLMGKFSELRSKLLVLSGLVLTHM